METEAQRFALAEAREVYRCSVFSVAERMARVPDGTLEKPMYVLRCADWVNVIPITASGDVVLVEQHRFGTDTVTWETPGGAVDPGERDVTMAALRELEEETGLTSRRLLALPGYAPNPALQNNRITFFLAFDVQPLAQPRDHDDPFERIQLRMVPVAEALQMARTGRISHALAALALLLAEPYLKARLS